MAVDAAKTTLFLAASVGVSAAAVLLFARFAPSLGLMDLPGGRKAHGRTVPLVGGLAIFASLLAVTTLLGIAGSAGHFLLALALIIAVGCWDDVAEISPRLKFAIQIGASAIMIWGAGVSLQSVGDLVGWRIFGLWIFAVPLTIFA